MKKNSLIRILSLVLAGTLAFSQPVTSYAAPQIDEETVGDASSMASSEDAIVIDEDDIADESIDNTDDNTDITEDSDKTTDLDENNIYDVLVVDEEKPVRLGSLNGNVEVSYYLTDIKDVTNGNEDALSSLMARKLDQELKSDLYEDAEIGTTKEMKVAKNHAVTDDSGVEFSYSIVSLYATWSNDYDNHIDASLEGDYWVFEYTVPQEDSWMSIHVNFTQDTQNKKVHVNVSSDPSKGEFFVKTSGGKVSTSTDSFYGNTISFRIAEMPHGTDHQGFFSTEYVFQPKPGYYLKGIYYDEAMAEKVSAAGVTLNEYAPLIKNEDGSYTLNLYAVWEPCAIEVRYNQTVIDTISIGDTFPEIELPSKPGYVYSGFTYNNAGKNTTIIPGQTVLVAGEYKKNGYYSYNYKYDYSSDSEDTPRYYVEIWTNYKVTNYNVIFHLNIDGNDAKITKKYTAYNGSVPIAPSYGDISGNTTTFNTAGFLGWTTKDNVYWPCAYVKGVTSLEGYSGPTVLDVIKYADERGTTTIDLYAQWEDVDNTYTVTFDTGLTSEEFATEKAYLSGEFFDNTSSHSETVALGETVLLTGKEYERLGYTLSGWTYTDAKGKPVTIKANASFKDISKGEDVTLKAVWTANTYKITYNYNGGKAKNNTVKNTVNYTRKAVADKTALLNYKQNGDSFDMLSADDQVVTKAGYAFAGWKAATDADIREGYYAGDIYENVTLIAQWTPATYSVNLQGQGGTKDGNLGYVIDDVEYGKNVNLKDHKFTRTGYTFKNWEIIEASDEKLVGKTFAATGVINNLFATGTSEDNHITLAANWTPVQYTITYNYNGGKLPKGVTNKNKYDIENGLVLNAPSRDRSDFAGWEITQKGYTDAAELPVMIDQDSSKLIKNPDATDPVYGNITLTAKYTPKAYTLKFYGSDWTYGKDNAENTTYLEDGDIVDFVYIAEQLEKGSDKSIIGFATSEANMNKKKSSFGISKNYTVANVVGNGNQDTVTLYPIWGDKTYHVNYLIDDDTKLAKAFYTYKTGKKDIALPTASKAGFTFDGYAEVELDTNGAIVRDENGNAKCLESAVNLTSNGKKIVAGAATDIVVMPIFKAFNIEVKYTPNGSGVKDADGKAVANKAESLGTINYATGLQTSEDVYADLLAKAATWERTGYTFAGFATSAKGKDPVTTLAGITTKKNITLYAIWTPNTYDMSFRNVTKIVNNSAKGIQFESSNDPDHIFRVETQTYGKAYKMPTPYIRGYAFTGWKLVDASGNELDTKNYPGVVVSKAGYVTSIKATNTDALTFRAEFSEFTYKITFNANGGTYTDNTGKAYKTVSLKDESGNINFYGSTDVTSNIVEMLDVERAGYTLRCLALDKAGKKPIVMADGEVKGNMYYLENGVRKYFLRALTEKNNGTATVYAVWDKVSPAKVTGVTAALTTTSSNKSLSVTIKESVNPEYGYQVQYSTNMLFAGTSTTVSTEYGENTLSTTLQYGSKYYVRVRRIMKDSTGRDVYGPWSSTVRASKSAG